MAYTPDVFADDEAGGTPITAAKLNKLGQGVQAVAVTADAATAALAGKASTADVAALDVRVDLLEAAPSGTSAALDDLTDVFISNLSDGQVLKRVGGQWVNAADATASGGSGTSNVLDGTQTGQVPVWDAVDGRYEPTTPTPVTAADVPFTPVGGIAATTVSGALAELDSEKATTGHSHAAQGISVQDENGTALTGTTLLDFQGAGVTAAQGAAGEVIVTIPGGGAGSTTLTTQDEGSNLSTTVTTLNFTGAGVTASGAGATTTVNIPGGGGSTAPKRARFAFGATTYLTIPGTQLGGSGTAAYGAGSVRYEPIYVESEITVDRAVAELTVAGAAGGQMRVAIYNSDLNGNPTTLVAESSSGALATDSGTVKNFEFSPALVLAPGNYVIAHALSQGVTMRINNAGAPGALPTLGANGLVANISSTTAFAAFPSTAPAITTVNGGASAFARAIFLRVSAL